MLGLLDLEGVDTDLFRSRAAGVPGHRLFGGQVAAQRWSPPSAPPPAVPGAHSLHAYFLRPGDTGKPVVYQVDRLQDGRTFRRLFHRDGTLIATVAQEGIAHTSQPTP